MTTIAVCVTAIPPRAELLAETSASIHAQTRPYDELYVIKDNDGRGTAWARDTAWRRTSSEWVMPFDDDDVMYPNHLEACLNHALETGADVVYPWFDGAYEDAYLRVSAWDQTDEKVPVEGRPWGDEHERHVLHSGPVCPPVILIRRKWLERVDGYDLDPTIRERRTGRQIDEWHLQRKLVHAQATFSHLPLRTWWRRPDGYHGRRWSP